MEGLIFKSDTTKTVYFWNGSKVVVILTKDQKLIPVGKIVKGISQRILLAAFAFSSQGFFVGKAHYSILKEIHIDDEKIESNDDFVRTQVTVNDSLVSCRTISNITVNR